MYKLFAAAQAIEFSVGCHARCSNFVVKSKEFPFASTPEVSAPANDKFTKIKPFEYKSTTPALPHQRNYSKVNR